MPPPTRTIDPEVLAESQSLEQQEQSLMVPGFDLVPREPPKKKPSLNGLSPEARERLQAAQAAARDFKAEMERRAKLPPDWERRRPTHPVPDNARTSIPEPAVETVAVAHIPPLPEPTPPPALDIPKEYLDFIRDLPARHRIFLPLDSTDDPDAVRLLLEAAAQHFGWSISWYTRRCTNRELVFRVQHPPAQPQPIRRAGRPSKQELQNVTRRVRTVQGHEVDPAIDYEARPLAAGLRALRVARGLSQDDLMRKSGIERNTISRLEGQVHAPRPETAAQLAKALEVSEAALFDPDPILPQPRKATPYDAARGRTEGPSR